MAQNVVRYALELNASGVQAGFEEISDAADSANESVHNLASEGADALSDLESQIDSTSESMGDMGAEAGQLGRGANQMARAVGMISPAAQKAILAVGALSMSIKGAQTVITGLNPLLLAGTGLVAASVGAWTYFSSAADEAEKAKEGLRKKQAELNVQLADSISKTQQYAIALQMVRRAEIKQTFKIQNIIADIERLQGKMNATQLIEQKARQNQLIAEQRIVDSKRAEIKAQEDLASGAAKTLETLKQQGDFSSDEFKKNERINKQAQRRADLLKEQIALYDAGTKSLKNQGKVQVHLNDQKLWSGQIKGSQAYADELRKLEKKRSKIGKMRRIDGVMRQSYDESEIKRLRKIDAKISALEKSTKAWTGSTQEQLKAAKNLNLNYSGFVVEVQHGNTFIRDSIRSEAKRESHLMKIRDLLVLSKQEQAKVSKGGRKASSAAKKHAEIMKKLNAEMAKLAQEMVSVSKQLDAIFGKYAQIAERARTDTNEQLSLESQLLRTQAESLTGKAKQKKLDEARAKDQEVISSNQNKLLEDIKAERKELVANVAALSMQVVIAKAKLDEVKNNKKAVVETTEAEIALAEATQKSKKAQDELGGALEKLSNRATAATKKRTTQDAIAAQQLVNANVVAFQTIENEYKNLVDSFQGRMDHPLQANINNLDILISKLKELQKESKNKLKFDLLLGDIETLKKQIKKEMEFEIKITPIIEDIERITAAIETLDSPDSFITALPKAFENFVGFVSDGFKSLAKSTEDGLIHFLSDKLGAFSESIKGLGQIGGAVGGVIGALASLGDSMSIEDEETGEIRMKTPEEIRQEMAAFTEAFKVGIRVLPSLLIEVMPELVVAIIQGIISAIPTLMYELYKTFERLWKSMTEFGPKDDESVGDYLMRKLMDWQKFWGWDQFGMNSQRAGGRIKSARQGLRFTSGPFGASIPAMLHPNEYVVPSSGQRPQAIERQLNAMNGGGGMNITINSMMTEQSAVDSLVRKIENRFKTFGSAKSSLFAS